MLRLLRGLGLGLVLTLSPALAETRIQIFAAGHWTLDKVDGLVIPYGRKSFVVDGMCNARSLGGSAMLSFSMGDASHDVSAAARDAVYIRLTDPQWNFAYAQGALFLVGGSLFGTPVAWFYKQSVTWEPAASSRPLVDFIASAGKTSLFVGTQRTVESQGQIKAVDAANQVIASIPADGLTEVFARLLKCAAAR